ncbi:MAG TPA: riboflavin synthase [Candidatus Kapabacteria bacterium]|jgi:riboflavin synthase|nr:riboflavin synthase [Candidatus Kapabacteria bacterium]HPU22531.1 riboflavin synthase [Candidatus Kapabacteria bacterium]
MFTGLVEEIGKVKKIQPTGGGLRFTVEASKIFDDLRIDDSVAINGVCQTVTEINGNSFAFVAVEETLSKTTLSELKAGSAVNLERALRPIDRMGGHIVQGHVDCIGKVTRIERLSTAVLVWVQFPREFEKYVVRTGSICIDGVSLTTARVQENNCMVSIIPHTWEKTILKHYSTGTKVNLEFDIIGKYVEKILGSSHGQSSILEQFKDQPEW